MFWKSDLHYDIIDVVLVSILNGLIVGLSIGILGRIFNIPVIVCFLLCIAYVVSTYIFPFLRLGTLLYNKFFYNLRKNRKMEDK